MKIVFVADGRSPIARNWIEYFTAREHEVYLISTFPSDPPEGLAGFEVISVGLSVQAGSASPGWLSFLRKLIPVELRTRIRHQLGVRTLERASRQLGGVLSEMQPDLIHAMRIPFEGMLAAMAVQTPAVLAMRKTPPLLVSIWGNDFTLHADTSPTLDHLTRLTLTHADAIHADCRRDVRLAQARGFSLHKPSTVLPGAGGVQSEIFYPSPLPPSADKDPIVIQPRGVRAYVQNEAFFHAIPLVLNKHPNARFLCPAMAGQSRPNRWVKQLQLENAVQLLPFLSRTEMADLFRQADITLSPTTHDGTPNTLLEAMACGCFPVAGNLESIREWISHGKNGLLVDPSNPNSIATGLITAIEDQALRSRARTTNLTLIAEQAVYDVVMPRAAAFYARLNSQ